ncbi:hypothetical protein K1T71_003560 [Dendrolimus kikuchii]|uniref:Uncharacterized protein n=1 Tax=Dendrolimus kikuchii TaxID=765133 RepID=A0ACC1DCD0_9NEOP|nr:hypothetical protein K1T71_003560 [Dendrolimus kikuchii]
MGEQDYVKGVETHDERRVGETSVLSMESDQSKMCYQYQNQDLQLLQKKELPSTRPIIPATKPERLSYFRTYAASSSKTQVICMQHITFNRFLWYYVINVIFKSLPHTFVHIFLASYAPEEHLFLSKMTPLFYGVKYSLIFAAFWDMITYLDTSTILMDYVVSGMLSNNPWNRCVQSSYYYGNLTVNCYTFEEFIKKFENETPEFDTIAYYSDTEAFQVSQIEYHRYYYQNHFEEEKLTAFVCHWVFILLFTAVLHRRVYKKSFWKILNILQWTVNGIDFMSFIYLTTKYFQAIFDDVPPVYVPVGQLTITIWKADIDILAESTTAPPIVHVLTARSVQEIEPSSDSAIMVLSNALCYIFRGWLIHRVKRYCESLAKTPIYASDLNSHSWFYFWPMYFSTFYLGNVYTLVFFTCHFVMELLSITVTYHCFVEAITCEWKWIRDWMITIVFSILGLVIMKFLSVEVRIIIYVYSKSIVTLTEVLLLYLVYPAGRLIDDITFHYGIPPTRLRIYSMKFVPLFYTIKFATLVDACVEVIKKLDLPKSDTDVVWSWCVMISPLALGMIYIMYYYIIKQKKSWKVLFQPDSTWGPRDLTARQFRKQYDSRSFIGSQAPRAIGRYLISKSESRSYRLDIRYDSSRRSNTVNTSEV